MFTGMTKREKKFFKNWYSWIQQELSYVSEEELQAQFRETVEQKIEEEWMHNDTGDALKGLASAVSFLPITSPPIIQDIAQEIAEQQRKALNTIPLPIVDKSRYK